MHTDRQHTDRRRTTEDVNAFEPSALEKERHDLQIISGTMTANDDDMTYNEGNKSAMEEKR